MNRVMNSGKPTLCIIGLGLIGGSLARALKARRWRGKIIGVSGAAALRAARRRSWIDAAFSYEKLAAAAAQSDVIILCVPIGRILELLPAVMRCAKVGAVVSDVGGTKLTIAELARRHQRRAVRFVGGHPIAGTARRGLAAADGKLFKGRVWVLTAPAKKTPALLLQIIRRAGAKPAHLTASQHDALYARVSHLPHLVAFALMNQWPAEKIKALAPFAGPTFLGMTRVAASPAENWADTVRTQGVALNAAIREFEVSWKKMKRALRKDDGRAFFAEAARRRKLLAG